MSPGAAPLVLTMGEPGGVGSEIAVKAHRALAAAGPVFFIVDDPLRLKALGVDVAVIERPEDAAARFPRQLPVLSLGTSVEAAAGVASPSTAAAVIRSIDVAVGLALAGKAAAVVTNPIQKSALHAAGFRFPGHTEYLGVLTAAAPMPAGQLRGPVMMLAGPALRTIPVTVHAPLVEAARMLSTQSILHAGVVAAEALRAQFGVAAPRIAVAGLNPHAGEKGALGVEDERVVAPAVKALCARGVDATGPHPADTLFHEDARARYDVALCMYHDQALIPVKTLDFHRTVNVTLGLPIIRTSPDHGTALDIAGKGAARADSLIAALVIAARLAERARA